MRFIPVILILFSFAVICLGVYLKTQHYAIANAVIIGGLIGEAIFIMLNRYLMGKKREA
jgi:hypothetical protein